MLRKLGEFRGESRFTTWAYKFALLEAGVKARRRAWQDRELPLEDEAWASLTDAGATTADRAETRELIGALREEIERGLSSHQRRVLVAVALNGVPIDVLAERLGDDSRRPLQDAPRRPREAAPGAGRAWPGYRRALRGGTMNEPRDKTDAARLLAGALGPAGAELTCEQCFEELDRYAELEHASADADAAVPGMRAHLEGCPACEEDHRSLLALLGSDA